MFKKKKKEGEYVCSRGHISSYAYAPNMGSGKIFCAKCYFEMLEKQAINMGVPQVTLTEVGGNK